MSEPSGTTPDTWLESYAVWSTALDLPPTHELVARMVVREKISQAIERLSDLNK